MERHASMMAFSCFAVSVMLRVARVCTNSHRLRLPNLAAHVKHCRRVTETKIERRREQVIDEEHEALKAFGVLAACSDRQSRTIHGEDEMIVWTIQGDVDGREGGVRGRDVAVRVRVPDGMCWCRACDGETPADRPAEWRRGREEHFNTDVVRERGGSFGDLEVALLETVGEHRPFL